MPRRAPGKPADWPKYVKIKKLAGGRSGYFFERPTWTKKKEIMLGKCPVVSEALGTDIAAAVTRGKQLADAFDAWLKGKEEPGPAIGTVSWLVAIYQQHDAYLSCSPRTRRGYDKGLKLIERHRLKSGRTFGSVALEDITPVVAQKLYRRLKYRIEGDGEPTGQPRPSTASAAIRPLKAAWNALWPEHHRIYPESNPFNAIDLEQTGVETTAATYEQMLAFVAKADELGMPSIGDAALIAFHWLQREADILERLAWKDYQPGIRIRIRHTKNKTWVWQMLVDPETGEQIFPEIEERLAQRAKRGPLIIMRDEPDRRTGEYLPWKEDYFRHKVADIRDQAGLPSDVTFTTYRHGGFTEAGDASGTDQELMAAGGHRTRQTVSVYTKRTNTQAATLARKRSGYRATRGKSGT